MSGRIPDTLTAEDRIRFDVLLEDVQRNVKVIAEGHGALVERLDRVEIRLERLEGRFEQIAIHVAVLETRSNALEAKFNALDTKLDSLSVDTRHRLQRIEAHLGLEGTSRSGKRSPRDSPKRRKAR